jgi:hypothetical protein
MQALALIVVMPGRLTYSGYSLKKSLRFQGMHPPMHALASVGTGIG